MSTEPEDFDLAGMAARYWDHCDGLGDYFAAGPLTDLIHMEDERIDESLRALIEENARLRRAMSFTQIGRGERSLRFGRRTS